MPHPPLTTLPRPSLASDGAQQGGVTILVSLMLLVLLTITAVGMSRNSMRDVFIAGTARQGSQVRNIADAGIHWSRLWIANEVQGATPTPSAAQLRALKTFLLTNTTERGLAYNLDQTLYDPTSPPPFSGDTTICTKDDTTQGYTVSLVSMGKATFTETSFGNRQGTPQVGREDNQPDLWSIRSDGQLNVGGLTFRHSKEVWLTTPVTGGVQ